MKLQRPPGARAPGVNCTIAFSGSLAQVRKGRSTVWAKPYLLFIEACSIPLCASKTLRGARQGPTSRFQSMRPSDLEQHRMVFAKPAHGVTVLPELTRRQIAQTESV